MDLPLSFGEWLKRRRKELDLTQVELAERASCTVFALRKIEAGERRPSKQLAGLIARSLEIPSEDQTTFMKVARGELNVERLRSMATVRAAGHSIDSMTSPSLVNLPFQPTPLIGREVELAALGKLLAEPHCRLLTITGLGGIGKTRLAIELGISQLNLFPGGVYYVSLASLNSPEFIVPAIAEVLRLSFSGAADPQEQLFNHLAVRARQPLLLVLDNLEHLLFHSAEQEGKDETTLLLTELLQRLPNMKILVTSRERSNLREEWIFELHGLPVPTSDQANRLEDYSSVALFLQCARQLKADFVVLPDERPSLARVCQLVEGTPLAIELAAAWVGMLSMEEIAQEIASNLDFLTTPMRNVPERHRSLRAVFAHSWKLLSDEERHVLCRLTVFRGGFSRPAAEQVAGASLRVLSTLVNRTLVRRVAAGRYDLHELVRQYSTTHLVADPQAHAAAQKRHYSCFLALAEAAEQELKGRDQLEWLGRLEQEHDNLRVALAWALESDHAAPGRDELPLRLAGALRWFWRMRGYFHEGRSWLTKSLQQCPERRTVARAVALLGKSLLLNALGDLGAACPPAEESAAIYRELGDQHGLAEALTLIGLTLVWHGEASLGHARLEEALAICRKVGDRWGEAQALYRLGSSLADYAGDPTGRAMLTQSAAILEDLGEKHVLTGVLISLGLVDEGSGDYAAARARFEHGLAIAREIEHPWGMADALTNLGCVDRILGEYSTAQSHLEKALQVYEEYGRSIWETDVLCALTENAISQGDLSNARFHLQAASNLLGTSENKWLQTLVCYVRGLLVYYEGDGLAAMMLLDETTALAREGQYKPDLARSLVALGRVKRTLGQIEPASELLLEGLDLFRGLGHKLGIANALEELGAVSAVQGDGLQAALLFSTAHALREGMGAPLPPVDRAAYDSVVAVTRAQLGETAFAEAWARAAARPVQEVVEEILKPH